MKSNRNILARAEAAYLVSALMFFAAFLFTVVTKYKHKPKNTWSNTGVAWHTNYKGKYLCIWTNSTSTNLSSYDVIDLTPPDPGAAIDL